MGRKTHESTPLSVKCSPVTRLVQSMDDVAAVLEVSTDLEWSYILPKASSD